MTRDEIFQHIQIAIKKTFPETDTNNININTHLHNDLGADSMDNISLMMELEDLFGASLPIEEAVGIVNIEQIIDLIDTRFRPSVSPTFTRP
jgi:acyl carrier protein